MFCRIGRVMRLLLFLRSRRFQEYSSSRLVYCFALRFPWLGISNTFRIWLITTPREVWFLNPRIEFSFWHSRFIFFEIDILKLQQGTFPHSFDYFHSHKESKHATWLIPRLVDHSPSPFTFRAVVVRVTNNVFIIQFYLQRRDDDTHESAARIYYRAQVSSTKIGIPRHLTAF